MCFYIGDPTNIIVGQAFQLTFLGYLMWMFLPTVVAGITCYCMCRIVFRKDLKASDLKALEIDPKSAITDRFGALFGVSMLITCLVFLSLATTLIKIDMGVICFVFAMIVLGRDLLHDIITRKKRIEISSATPQQSTSLSADKPYVEGTSKNSRSTSTIKKIVKRMPWTLLPFVVGMFVMVEILFLDGWIGFFANIISFIQNSLGLFGAILFMTFLSALVCNIMNNQPMTILFTRILLASNFNSPALKYATMYALIMGSNFGSNLTLIGALAGIMWMSIAKEKGVRISYKKFAYYGFRVMPLCIVASCIMLYIEFLIFPQFGVPWG
jgi:Na+/H+ antiporter NhaD/arsenite permease-like protein